MEIDPIQESVHAWHGARPEMPAVGVDASPAAAAAAGAVTGAPSAMCFGVCVAGVREGCAGMTLTHAL